MHNPKLLHILLYTPQIHKDVIDEHKYKRIQIGPKHVVYHTINTVGEFVNPKDITRNL